MIRIFQTTVTTKAIITSASASRRHSASAFFSSAMKSWISRPSFSKSWTCCRSVFCAATLLSRSWEKRVRGSWVFYPFISFLSIYSTILCINIHARVYTCTCTCTYMHAHVYIHTHARVRMYTICGCLLVSACRCFLTEYSVNNFENLKSSMMEKCQNLCI